MVSKKQKDFKKHVKELTDKHVTPDIRHYYGFLANRDLDSKKALIDRLEELRDKNIVVKKINMDKGIIEYRSTEKCRRIHREYVTTEDRAVLLLFQCLYNICLRDISDHRERLYEAGRDIKQNFDVNLFRVLRDNMDVFSNFSVPDDVLESLERDMETRY